MTTNKLIFNNTTYETIPHIRPEFNEICLGIYINGKKTDWILLQCEKWFNLYKISNDDLNLHYSIDGEFITLTMLSNFIEEINKV